MNYFQGLVLLALLAGCGSPVPAVVPGKKKIGNEEQGQQSCPAQGPSSFHRFTIHFLKPLPAKVGLKLDIDTEMRLSECAARTQTKPFATQMRQGNGTTLVVQVDHLGFYNPLPRDVSFELFDLQNCGPALASLLAVKNEPLAWKVEYPNGESCAGRAVAEREIIN